MTLFWCNLFCVGNNVHIIRKVFGRISFSMPCKSANCTGIMSNVNNTFFPMKEELFYPSLLFLPPASTLEEAESAKWGRVKVVCEEKCKVENTKLTSPILLTLQPEAAALSWAGENLKL